MGTIAQFPLQFRTEDQVGLCLSKPLAHREMGQAHAPVNVQLVRDSLAGPGLPTSRVSSLADNSIVVPVGTHRVAACHPRSLCGARVARLLEAETETEQAMLGLIHRTLFSLIESAAASDPVLDVKRGPRGGRENLGWVPSHQEGAGDHACCVRRPPQLRPRARSRKADSRPRLCGKAGRSYRDDTVL
jgi:hypothetical protein